MQETRFKMHDAGFIDTRYKIQDTRYRIQDTRYKIQDSRFTDASGSYDHPAQRGGA
jgi:hypothetical protein